MFDYTINVNTYGINYHSFHTMVLNLQELYECYVRP